VTGADRDREHRRERLFDAMAAHDLDVLVLGRPAEVHFATGAVQLWTAGTRPFGPACVAVAETGRTHLLSVSDDGVPDEVAHEDLYGLSWNPAVLTASLAAIPGMATARRVGTTSSSPGFARLVQAVAPEAEVVDGSTAIWAARETKAPDEIARLATAVDVAEEVLSAMVERLRPGVTERDLLATYLERIAALGVPTPPTEGVACAIAAEGPVRLRRIATNDPIPGGALVALDPGVVVDGYEGGVGRTRVVGADPSEAQEALARRCQAAVDAVVEVCWPGARGAALVDAWTATGEALPNEPLVVGMGLGVELPIVGHGVGHEAVLGTDGVVAISGWVAEAGVGGVYERDLVLVTDSGPRRLSVAGAGLTGER
jgi:Xaa-Pro aminopeptidase